MKTSVKGPRRGRLTKSDCDRLITAIKKDGSKKLGYSAKHKRYREKHSVEKAII